MGKTGKLFDGWFEANTIFFSHFVSHYLVLVSNWLFWIQFFIFLTLTHTHKERILTHTDSYFLTYTHKPIVICFFTNTPTCNKIIDLHSLYLTPIYTYTLKDTHTTLSSYFSVLFVVFLSKFSSFLIYFYKFSSISVLKICLR